MSRKYAIEVRDETSRKPKTIKRVLISEICGNFNPFFCRYNGKKHLVHSDAGDLSDPFRRDESYAESFFIKV